MEWLSNPQNTILSVCPRSACYSNMYCGCQQECKKNTAFCLVEVGGVTCKERSCLLYFG